jgi:hypothetical protein
MTSNMGRKARRSVVVAAVTAGGIVALSGAALAGTTSSSGTTTANVDVASGITMTGLTSSFTLSGAPGDTANALGAVSFNVETNDAAGYNVTVQSQNDTLQPTIPGNTDYIPIAALKVSDGGANEYQSVENSGPVTVHSQSNRSIDGGDNLTNDYRMLIPVVRADTYTATLDYIASGQ